MRFSLASPLAALLLALACGPSQAPVSPPPAASEAPATSALPSPQTDEAHVVRCGIDDRPVPVSERPSGASRHALLGAPLGPALPLEMAMPVPIAPPPLPPGPQVTLEQGPPRLRTGPAPASLTAGMTGAASPEACEALAAEADAGPLDLEVDLASSAAPLRVRQSRRGAPSPYVRCLMERACQVRASREAASQRLTLPLLVKVEPPPPPPPPPAPPPPSATVLATPARGQREDFAVQIVQGQINAFAQQCAQGRTLPKSTFGLRIELAQQEFGASTDRRALMLVAKPMPPGPTLRVTRVITEGTIAPPLHEFVACLTGAMNNRTFFVGRGISKATQRQVRLSIAVTPP